MKNLLWSFMLLIGITMLSISDLQAKGKNKQLLGEWAYEVSDAPNGYEKGSLIFSEKDGKTICTIKVEAGQLEATNLNVEKDQITFDTMVEGNSVHVTLYRIKNKLTGKVDSPEGPKIMSAEKK